MEFLIAATKYTGPELDRLGGYDERLVERAKNPRAPETVKKAAPVATELIELLRQGKYQFQDQRGNTIAVVHRSTQENRGMFPWQVSYFWPSRQPGGAPEAIGHVSAQDLRGVLVALAEDGTVYPSTVLGSSFLFQARQRQHYTPLSSSDVIRLPISVEDMKASPDYRSAKSGDEQAAIRLVRSFLTEDFQSELKSKIPSGSIFVFPHASEASGLNSLPAALAGLCARLCGGSLEEEVFQTNRTFHTGAPMMDRVSHGAEFDGAVESGRNYVLVDDNLTSGGTLADLGSYIVASGGNVAGVVVLTVSERYGKLPIDRKAAIKRIKGRFGDVVQDELGINPEALTDSELSYLSAFRDADELRARISKAKQERDRRLDARGLQRHDPSEDGSLSQSFRFSKALRSEYDLVPIQSLTIKDLRRAEDPAFLKKGIRREELEPPVLNRCYASTVEYLIKSSKYDQNHIVYNPKILFKDFVYIAKDKGIPFDQAIRYSIEHGDCHVWCPCKSFSFHGFAFISRQLGTLYGLPNPKNQKFPKVRNSQLRSVYCKHLSRVLEKVVQDEQLLISKFSAVYNRNDLAQALPQEQGPLDANPPS